MDDGTITYDYPTLEECISLMSKKANEIETLTSELEGDVKKIMVDWKGSTADSYNSLANDLRQDLEDNKNNLNNLNSALVAAAEKMKHQDSSGAARI